MYLTAPSSYMSAADPRILRGHETVVRDASTGRWYTPKDYPRLSRDAGLAWVNPIANHYIGFVKFADPATSRASTSTPRRDRASRRWWERCCRTSTWAGC